MFIPKPKLHGGTQLGNSYISLWHLCRRKWFLEHVYPNQDGGQGIRRAAGGIRVGNRGLMGGPVNLMLGSLLHEFRAAWYSSGVKDGDDTGQYDRDAGLAAMASYALKRKDEFADDEAFELALTTVSSWCDVFHRFYGPEGHVPLYPNEKVLCYEDGTPAVETELSCPLGYQDYVYTSRLDAVTLYLNDYVLAQEHKTAAPSWINRYIERLPKTSQYTGEMWVLRNHPELRDLPWEGIQVNFHAKGWTPKSSLPSPVLSAKTSRNPQALEAWKLKTIRTLQEIDLTVHCFRERLQRGEDLHILMDGLFPETGENTGNCYAYNSECEFIDLCKNGIGPGTLGSFRSTQVAEPSNEEAG